MNRYVLLLLLLSSSAFAQAGFETLLPPQPLGDTLQIKPDYAYVQGHWVATGESKLAGPSVSTISCDRKGGVCEEDQGNITVMGESFTLSADHLEYKIERWTTKDIVAARIGGICQVRSVVKIDIAERKVFYSEALSEPVDELAARATATQTDIGGPNDPNVIVGGGIGCPRGGCTGLVLPPRTDIEAALSGFETLPKMSKDVCKLVGMNLELKQSRMFVKK